MKSIVRAWAPGKLIITGEHAVVVGVPAIAVALRAGVTVTLRADVAPGFSFCNEGVLSAKFSVNELHTAARKIYERFEAYLVGKVAISEVLDRPEFLGVAIVEAVSYQLLQLGSGYIIDCHSDLPFGCGMGSSAAFIIALLTALNRYLGRVVTFEKLWQEGRQFEHLQHGQSSGLDIALALNGGSYLLNGTELVPLAVTLPELWLVQTGHPASTTGEAVQQSCACFKVNPDLKNEFGVITEKIKKSLIISDENNFWKYLQQNHELLVKLGVVPLKVQNFVHGLIKLGSTAKLSGAGAVRGDAAGILIVRPMPGLAELATRAGYTLSKLEVTPYGARCL